MERVTAQTPPRGTARSSAPLAIRDAHPEDAELLTEVAHAAKRVWGYPEEWMALWADAVTITPEFLAGATTRVAEVGDAVVGFASTTHRWRRARLEHLWVIPRAMRLGVGRALFDSLADDARRRGATFLLIESDPYAEAFYERVGAVRIGETYANLAGERRMLPLMRVEL